MNMTNRALLGAAIAGILGAGMASNAMAKEKSAAKKVETEKCYGINKCSGHGKCGGEGHACASQNKCSGQGWLEVPKGLCMEINGGSLEPKKS